MPDRVQNPSFHIPTQDPRSVADLQRYAKTVMLVELSTIPLYLYAMCSIDKRRVEGENARVDINEIVLEKLLHLFLAGNLLTALGGSLDFYQDGHIPKYPGHILKDNLEMDLSAADKEQLTLLKRIEPPVPSSSGIGKFYDDLRRGLQPEDLWQGLLASSDCNPDKQFTADEFWPDEFHFPPGLAIIENRDTALQIMDLIIGQRGRSGDSRLTQLARTQNLPLWTGRNPRTENYKHVYTTSLAFDASYCYLLQTIQRVWQTDRGTPRRKRLTENIAILLESVMKPLATILFRASAAPCFNYYDLGEGPVTPSALHAELEKLVAELADKVTEKQKFEKILEEIKKATPEPQI